MSPVQNFRSRTHKRTHREIQNRRALRYGSTTESFRTDFILGRLESIRALTADDGFDRRCVGTKPRRFSDFQLSRLTLESRPNELTVSTGHVMTTHSHEGREVIEFEQEQRLIVDVVIFSSGRPVQWAGCQATCQHRVRSRVAEPECGMMMVGYVDVLLADHPETSPDLHDADEGEQVKDVENQWTHPFVTSFDETLNDRYLYETQEKEENIANSEWDQHRRGLVMWINVKIRQIVQSTPGNDDQWGFDHFVTNEIERVLPEAIRLEKCSSAISWRQVERHLLQRCTSNRWESKVLYRYQSRMAPNWGRRWIWTREGTPHWFRFRAVEYTRRCWLNRTDSKDPATGWCRPRQGSAYRVGSSFDRDNECDVSHRTSEASSASGKWHTIGRDQCSTKRKHSFVHSWAEGRDRWYPRRHASVDWPMAWWWRPIGTYPTSRISSTYAGWRRENRSGCLMFSGGHRRHWSLTCTSPPFDASPGATVERG